MTRRERLTLLAILIVVLVIIADQSLKIWVKTHFYLGEQIEILPWFRLLFIQNNGMAFGMEMGSKIFLTLFRIGAVGFLIYYMALCLRRLRDLNTGYLVCVALITAGAAGNIFDCLFYGLIFNNPAPPQVATLFPPDGGYAPLLEGRVVDMLYFPLFSFTWPDWMPWFGGENFQFFQPVFNLADAAITVGILMLIIFYAKYLMWPSPQAVSDTPTDARGPR